MRILDTPETEAKYQRLEALGRKLGVPILGAKLDLQVMKDGKMITHHKQRSHSWVRNAYNLAIEQLGSINPTDATFGAGLLSFKSVVGDIIRYTGTYVPAVARVNYYDPETEENESVGRGARAAANDEGHGLVVGTNGDPESFEHYDLLGRIPAGLGAGQLSMLAQEAHNLTYDAETKTLTNTMVRFMNNNSGGDITVREVGFIIKMQTGTATNMKNFLLSRDVVSPEILIPNAGQIRIQYDISLVYPA